MPVPRISGTPLKTLARLARTSPGAASVYRKLRADLRAADLVSLPEGLRGGFMLSAAPLQGRPPREAEATLPLPPSGWAPTSDGYAKAYVSGEATPVSVVERCFALARELAERKPSFGPLLAVAEEDAMREAHESLDRIRRGAARGPLDGVPFAVKEQCAVRGLPRQSGTRYLPHAPMEADAAAVEPLRRAGAIVLGTTPMTELGLSPLGQSSLRTMPHNPHGDRHLAGGSSTGSGVAVGTGLVPFAIGVDGGGSVRIPAAWNGVFGLKPTWGRVSRRGTLAEGSMAHVGPIASSTIDLARTLEILSEGDPEDDQTAAAPRLAEGALVRALGRGVKGLRIGVEEREWAEASPDMQRAGREAMRLLEREGAILVPIRLELARFAVGIGTLSIGPESRAICLRDILRHMDMMSPEVQISFAALSCVSSTEHLDAQRLRTGLRAELAHAFGDIDLIALPTTADPPPAVTAAEMTGGFLDAGALGRACRYAFLGNLSGLPCGTAPAGTNAAGLPLGFQLVGDAWDEATVLAGLAHLERIGFSHPPKPKVFVNPLAAKAR